MKKQLSASWEQKKLVTRGVIVVGGWFYACRAQLFPFDELMHFYTKHHCSVESSSTAPDNVFTSVQWILYRRPGATFNSILYDGALAIVRQAGAFKIN